MITQRVAREIVTFCILQKELLLQGMYRVLHMSTGRHPSMGARFSTAPQPLHPCIRTDALSAYPLRESAAGLRLQPFMEVANDRLYENSRACGISRRRIARRQRVQQRA